MNKLIFQQIEGTINADTGTITLQFLTDYIPKNNSDLVAKYGGKIHGLTEESRQEALTDQLIPYVIYEIDQQIKTI